MTGAIYGRVLALTGLVVVAVDQLAPHGAPSSLHAAVAATSIVIALGAWRASAPVRSLNALLACLAAMLLPVVWQAVMLVALVAFLGLGRAIPALRPFAQVVQQRTGPDSLDRGRRRGHSSGALRLAEGLPP